MEKVMRVLADDIALGLLNEWRSRKAVPVPPVLRARDMSVDPMTQESVSQQEDVQTSAFSDVQTLLRRLQQVESTVEQMAQESVSHQENVQTSAFSDVQILLRRLQQVESTVEQIAQESVSQQENVQTSTPSERQFLSRGIQQVESTLEKLAARIQAGRGEYEAESDLGGEGSKYQNVETMLKYVDGSGAEGGVKLVIMNFND